MLAFCIWFLYVKWTCLVALKLRFCCFIYVYKSTFYLGPTYAYLGKYLNFFGNAHSCFVISLLLWIESAFELHLLFTVPNIRFEQWLDLAWGYCSNNLLSKYCNLSNKHWMWYFFCDTNVQNHNTKLTFLITFFEKVVEGAGSSLCPALTERLFHTV